MDRITKWHFWWRHTDVLTRIIVVNVAIAVVIFLVGFGIPSDDIINLLGLIPSGYELSQNLWALFTHFWIHSGGWHLLSNMVFLYVFGRIYLRYRPGISLLILYLMGGIAGGLCYIMGYHLADLAGHPILPIPLVGASAAIMAVSFGIAFYARWEEIRIWGLGRVKLYRVAVVILLMLFLMNGHTNYGGHLAHIGGMAIGLIYAFFLHKQQIDITNPFIKVTRFVKRNLHPSSKRQRSSFRSSQPNKGRTEKQGDTVLDLDIIFDKIRQGGYNSLSVSEKRRLLNLHPRQKSPN